MSDGGCSSCSGFDPLDGRTPVCQCGTGWAKPRKRLQRRTPLAAGSKGLSRGAGLAHGDKGLSRSAPMAHTAKAPTTPRRPRVSGEVRDVVLARSRQRCEVGITPACRARGRRLDSPEGTNQHHRHPGGMGGSKRAGVHAASNLLQVCGQGNVSGCHGAIESNRTAAYEAGWLVRHGEDPAVTPVRLWDGRRVLLTADGYRDTPHPSTQSAVRPCTVSLSGASDPGRQEDHHGHDRSQPPRSSPRRGE